MDAFTTDELELERKRSERLADLCFRHGQIDGGKAHRATADAIGQELTERGRARG